MTDQDWDWNQNQDLMSKIASILTKGERVAGVAMQNAINAPVKRDFALVTNRRFIIFRPKLFGRMNLVDFLWQDIDNVSVSTQVLGATLVVHGKRKTINGRYMPHNVSIGGLEKRQALRLYAKAQELEEQWREKNRVRTMEEERARAGGVYLGGHSMGASPSGAGGSTNLSVEDRLAKLKALHAKALITDAEYESRKAQIISEL